VQQVSLHSYVVLFSLLNRLLGSHCKVTHDDILQHSYVMQRYTYDDILQHSYLMQLVHLWWHTSAQLHDAAGTLMMTYFSTATWCSWYTQDDILQHSYVMQLVHSWWHTSSQLRDAAGTLMMTYFSKTTWCSWYTHDDIFQHSYVMQLVHLLALPCSVTDSPSAWFYNVTVTPIAIPL
jgi:hypothetical protein